MVSDLYEGTPSRRTKEGKALSKEMTENLSLICTPWCIESNTRMFTHCSCKPEAQFFVLNRKGYRSWAVGVQYSSKRDPGHPTSCIVIIPSMARHLAVGFGHRIGRSFTLVLPSSYARETVFSSSLSRRLALREQSSTVRSPMTRNIGTTSYLSRRTNSLGVC